MENKLVIRRSSFVVRLFSSILAFRKVSKSQSLKVLMLFLLTFTNCGELGVSKKPAYPAEVTSQMKTEFRQIEEQYRRQNYEYAFSGYQNFIKTYPYNELTDESYYKQGKIFFLGKRYDEAKQKFTDLAQKTPSSVYRSKAWHMVGYSEFRRQNYQNSLEALKKVEPQELPTKLRVQYYSLMIENGQQYESAAESADRAKLDLYNLYEGFAGESLKNLGGANIVNYSMLQKMIDTWVDTPQPIDQIPSWMKKYPGVPAKAYVEYKLGKIYYEGGDKSKARRYFSRFVNQYPKHSLYPSAQKILVELGGPEDVVELKKANYKVGVLLPQSGRYLSFGQALLDGVRCAVGADNACGPDSGIQLVVKDSGFTPESVKVAVDELAKENVVAIIGPLSGDLAVEAGIAATAKHIPIFPITQKTDLMSQGDYIFQVGIQPKQQIEALVKVARDRGFKTFGVFYPNNSYGQTMAELFIEEIKKFDGRVTAQAEYNKRFSDPFAEARKLKNSIGRLSMVGKGVGFDALFIPDSYQTINALVSGLEFNGIQDVPLLGTNAWNDPALTAAIATKYPGSFFVDLYDGTSTSKTVTSFKNKFSQSFGRSPRVLEAYGYDIMMMIRSVSASKGANNIKDGLNQNRGFNGVTGIRGFRIGDGPVVESKVLSIKSSGVGG